MKGRLLCLVGPSGSGKDSIIEWARTHVRDDVDLRIARRVITRPVTLGAEQHMAVSEYQFDLLAASDQFALHWRANGLRYGIGREVRDWLAEGAVVVLNGSRQHVDEAIAAFPQIEVVHVTAPADVRRNRLASRAREDAVQIDARVARGQGWQLPADVPVTELVNDADLATAGRALVALIERGPGTWTPQLIDRTTRAQPARSAARPRAPSPRRAPRTTVADSLTR